MSDLGEAVRVAIANALNRRAWGSEEPPVHPNDIDNISLSWDSGDRYNPTYGADSEPPTLEFNVEVAPNHPQRAHRLYVTVDVETVLTALLQAVIAQ